MQIIQQRKTRFNIYCATAVHLVARNNFTSSYKLNCSPEIFVFMRSSHTSRYRRLSPAVKPFEQGVHMHLCTNVQEARDGKGRVARLNDYFDLSIKHKELVLSSLRICLHKWQVL